VNKGDASLFGTLLAQGGEFAFVVFGIARAQKALPGEWEGLLTLTVALSMACTPLLLLAVDKLRMLANQTNARADDEIENEDAPVIIAGFGRFGQIVGRLLFASGIRATVLDHDPDQIDMLRRFGFRIFYGDATRLDLLHAAGAGKARVLVNAIDDVDDSLELTDMVRGVEVVERETFESALLLGRRTLEQLSVPPYEAKERVDRFRRHNIKQLDLLSSQFLDEAQRMSAAKAAREELERQFERDRAALDRDHHVGWQADGE
jgi:glutathione-regulated potassium-efflux system ancillary protein KefC